MPSCLLGYFAVMLRLRLWSCTASKFTLKLLAAAEKSAARHAGVSAVYPRV